MTGRFVSLRARQRSEPITWALLASIPSEPNVMSTDKTAIIDVKRYQLPAASNVTKEVLVFHVAPLEAK
jgi:hypothetical protein